MGEENIRHTKRGRHYRAPVMLDHRALQKIGLGMVVSMVVLFVSGYVVGLRQVEAELNLYTPSAALALPEPVAIDPEEVVPQTPLTVEPGETIDVDNPDAQVALEKKPHIELPPESETDQDTEQVNALSVLENTENKDMQNAEIISPSTVQSIGGPAQSDPEQLSESGQLAIYDNTTEADARYSIQVGMFGQLDNAERKVEALISVDLSAYLVEFSNKHNKIRYNVRFGYFADWKSAKSALDIYQNEFAGSGYVIRLQLPRDTESKTPA